MPETFMDKLCDILYRTIIVALRLTLGITALHFVGHLLGTPDFLFLLWEGAKLMFFSN